MQFQKLAADLRANNPSTQSPVAPKSSDKFLFHPASRNGTKLSLPAASASVRSPNSGKRLSLMEAIPFSKVAEK